MFWAEIWKKKKKKKKKKKEFFIWKIFVFGCKIFSIFEYVENLYADRIFIYFCIKSSIGTQGEVG